MIRVLKDRLFVLDTLHTTYAFRVLHTGHPEHLYYGARITVEDEAGLAERHAFPPGNTCLYDDDPKKYYTLEDMRLEMSWPGKGDLREPAVALRHADGGRTRSRRHRRQSPPHAASRPAICDKSDNH